MERTCDWVLRFCRIREKQRFFGVGVYSWPFLLQFIYVPGCLAISALAPRPLARAFNCV